MATIEDLIGEFPEDYETKESPGTFTPVAEKETAPTGDKCFLALKAAMDTVGEYCGMEGYPVTLAGITVRVPSAVLRVATSKEGIPRETRVKAIRESTWMVDLSHGLCTEIRGSAGTSEHERCAAALGERMTDELVK
ncbi:MAG: hypothetical protein GWP10_20510 [Nitrospiraceae bacterium]|nr:hypothetical protein [Nitrospiraceae bacterium]